MAKRIEVKGLRELGMKFKQLDYDVQSKIARAATNAGAQVMRKAIAKNAPVAEEAYKQPGVIVQPGNLGRNVVVKRLKESETPATSEHLVVMRGKRKYGYASRVGSLQEFGTVEQAPQPFFRPGANESIDAAASAVKERFGKRIDKAIKDLSK